MISVLESIKKLREHLGYTQPEFAQLIGVSTRTLARYEGGRPPSTVQTLGRLAKLASDNGRDDLASVFSGEFLKVSPGDFEENTVWFLGFQDVLANQVHLQGRDLVDELKDKIVYALRRIAERQRQPPYNLDPEHTVAGTLAECEAAIEKRDFERKIDRMIYELFNLERSAARPFEDLWATLTNDFGEGYRQQYAAMELLIDQALKPHKERDSSVIQGAIQVFDSAHWLRNWPELKPKIRAYFDNHHTQEDQ